MFRIVLKCPYCNKKPWIRSSIGDGKGPYIMGCCRMYTKYPTEVETRSAWNDMAERHLGIMR